jgi:aspartyl-tRNA synthetase
MKTPSIDLFVGRRDRQPEFTQIDLELSFVSREHIFSLIEQLLSACWPDPLPNSPFPRLTYAQCMTRYGTDKPDTRFALEIEHTPEQLFITSPVPLTEVTELLGNTNIQYDDKQRKFSLQRTDNEEQCLVEMGRFRLRLADVLEQEHKMELRKGRRWNFLWVIDFPLFTPTTDDRNKLESTHHPFTAPIDDHLSLISSPKDWPRITGQHYDLVLNGFEVAGGSIRIYDSALQRFILNDILHLPIEHLEHLLKALEYGAPPHGGIALGLDRLLALALQTEHIRDVIAFPKTSLGKDLMAEAPSAVEQSELDYYFLKINQKLD